MVDIAAAKPDLPCCVWMRETAIEVEVREREREIWRGFKRGF